MRKNQGISAPFEIGDLATRIQRWPHALTAPELADLLAWAKGRFTTSRSGARFHTTELRARSASTL